MSDWNSERIQKQRDEEWAIEKEDREGFLKRSNAVPMSAEVYAIWLELYLRKGGTVKYTRTYDFQRSATQRHEDIHARYWVPTQDGGMLPANYGSAALTLLILPEVTNQNVYPATDDRRQGWEWGHSKVLTIVRDDSSPTGFLAETSDPYGAETYADVQKIRRSMNLTHMLAKYSFISEDMMAVGEFGRLVEEQDALVAEDLRKASAILDESPESPKGYFSRFL